MFIVAPSLAGLIAARILSGISVGLTTATATSYLPELHDTAHSARSARRADVVATAANLGGIGLGPLVAGLLAQFAPGPLRLPYQVFGVALIVLAAAIALSPETLSPPNRRPRYRPQSIAAPTDARATFFAATLAGVAAFAVFGVFNSLVPAFLAGTLHETSHAIAGAVPFAAFAAGAVAQIVQVRTASRSLLRRSVPVIAVGLALTVGAMWLASLPMFIIGGVVVGAGAGMVFKGALVVAAATAPPASRAEVLAGFFLGAYIGLSLPVVGLGLATLYVPARDAILVFAVLATLAITASVRAVIGGPSRRRGGSAGLDTPVDRAAPVQHAATSPGPV